MRKTLQKILPPVFPRLISTYKESIKYRITAVVFIIFTLFALLALGMNYRDDRQRIDEQINRNFSLIAGMCEYDISRWLEYRKKDVAVMAANPLVRQYIAKILTDSPQADQAKKELERFWKNIQEQYGIFDEIYFVSIGGKFLASTNPEREGTFRPRDALIRKPLESGTIYFQDAYRAFDTNKPCIAFAAPVRLFEKGTGSENEYAGVLVFRIDINTVIKPLLESRVNLGETGEVILVNKDGTAITELRDRPDSALRYTLHSEPARQVIKGKEGIMRSTGYNGREVISVFRYLPETNWGIIVRQETSEIYSNIRSHMLHSLGLNMLAVFVVLGIIYITLNRFLKPAAAMAEVAGHISRKDFSQRVGLVSGDELGRLGRAVNDMADALEHQFKIQKSRQDVLQELVTTLETDSLLNRVLVIICQSFNFQVGAVYLVDRDGRTLVRKAVFCPGPELMQRERISIGEGMEGYAALSRQLQVTTGLPGETVYSVNWSGGSIVPAAVMAVPLVFGDQTLGVLSLASLQQITEQDIREMADIGALVGVAVNNALSYTRTLELARHLQELNEQLAQQNEELNAQSEELVSQAEEMYAQSDELKAITRELQAKNIELEKIGQRRSKFLASLSHELRAPLSAMISFSEVLLDRAVGDLNSRQEKYLIEIMHGGRHLLNLVNDLLDLSKIEAGQVELKIRDIDPSDVLEKVLDMLSAEVTRKKMQVKKLIPRNQYTIAADEAKLKQVFLNLLTNAVKFTPEGGSITVGAGVVEDNMLALWVADTGIGIPGEYHQEIFDEFKQGGNIPVDAGGTGLGLAITKKLVELQGGEISVKSAPGQGATFTFIVPLAAGRNKATLPEKTGSAGHNELPRPVARTINGPEYQVFFLTKPVRLSALNECLVEAARRKAKEDLALTVLVIDDDPAVRNYISYGLENGNYMVLSAENGRQGIDMALKYQPEIIILDIVMPGMDGFQVVDRLAGYARQKELMMVVLTSRDIAKEEKEFIRNRIRDMFNKSNV